MSPSGGDLTVVIIRFDFVLSDFLLPGFYQFLPLLCVPVTRVGIDIGIEVALIVIMFLFFFSPTLH